MQAAIDARIWSNSTAAGDGGEIAPGICRASIGVGCQCAAAPEPQR